MFYTASLFCIGIQLFSPNLIGSQWYGGCQICNCQAFHVFHAFSVLKILPYVEIPVPARPGKPKSRPTSAFAMWKCRKVLQVSNLSNRECQFQLS